MCVIDVIKNKYFFFKFVYRFKYNIVPDVGKFHINAFVVFIQKILINTSLTKSLMYNAFDFK